MLSRFPLSFLEEDQHFELYAFLFLSLYSARSLLLRQLVLTSRLSAAGGGMPARVLSVCQDAVPARSGAAHQQ